MEPFDNPEYAFEAEAPVKCDYCGRTDVFPLPVQTFLDKVAWAAFRGPYRCRACHKKFYRKIRKLALEEPEE